MATDWLQLWWELASGFYKWGTGDQGQGGDVWKERARRFDASAKRRMIRPDPLRDFVLSHVDAQSTALDIGAGTGSWTMPLARAARQVTAVEPSASMAAILEKNLAAEGLSNIIAVRCRWEEAEVEPHDVALCSHAMYSSPDLLGFVRKMERSARQYCFLVLRLPSHEGVLGQLCRLIHGHPHDSPNFIVAYNAMISAGIYANVMVESELRPWTNDSLEAAFQRVKDHLRLEDDQTYDDQIRALLKDRLTFKDGLYYWPDGMRSALIWWNIR